MKEFEISNLFNFSIACDFLAYFIGPNFTIFFTLGWSFIILISLVICSPE